MKNLLLLFIAILSLSACVKKNNINGRLENRREILMSRSWRIKNIRDNGQYMTIEPCKRDNYYVFDGGGEGRWEESLNNCFASNTPPPIDSTDNNDTTTNNDTTINSNVIGQTEPVKTYTHFRWSMISNLQFIYLKDFGREGYNPEWEIENMDYNSLDILYSETIDGVNHRYEVELIAL